MDARHGLTGECARSGRLMSCEDTETDPRVDRNLCRELGIGSILAAPILSDFRVVGLIEVFSHRPRAFTKTQETVLDRLVELVPKEPARAPVQLNEVVVGALPAKSEFAPVVRPVVNGVVYNGSGKFTLTGVPSGANIPVVVQAGKWRRTVVLPNVSACTKTALPASQRILARQRAIALR